MDQSDTLRSLAQTRANNAPPTRVITVSSGKGGVGKSNFVLNVGLSLARLKKRVLLLDADMGLANIDILVGLTTRFNLSHVLTGEKTLEEVIVKAPGGIDILPAASGVEWMTNLTQEQKLDFLQKMDALNGVYDILLIDTGAGISSNVVYFNLAAQSKIVLVTPEPTSLTDAYALIKVLHRSHQQKNFEIVINQVQNEQEGIDVYRNLTSVADRFLDVRLGFLGYVRKDERLCRAVLRQTPVVEAFPDADVSVDYQAVARKITQSKPDLMASELGLFWRDLFQPAAH
ncbi:TPA: flagellar synthesis regulator FleN [Candidatus Sumerlaeota bacterium]|jgi:flagellar biosynthesis protein FlhG|nr:flagellar synthesis regulator FleN [Candidatus Sumerlaeota bacterium]